MVLIPPLRLSSAGRSLANTRRLCPKQRRLSLKVTRINTLWKYHPIDVIIQLPSFSMAELPMFSWTFFPWWVNFLIPHGPVPVTPSYLGSLGSPRLSAEMRYTLMFSSTFGERQLVPSSPGQPRRNPLTTPGVEGEKHSKTGGEAGENVQNLGKCGEINENRDDKIAKSWKASDFWGEDPPWNGIPTMMTMAIPLPRVAHLPWRHTLHLSIALSCEPGGCFIKIDCLRHITILKQMLGETWWNILSLSDTPGTAPQHLKGAFRVVGILRARLGQSDEADGILAAPQEGKLMKKIFCRWISCQKDPKSEASKMFQDVPLGLFMVFLMIFPRKFLHLICRPPTQVLAPAPASVVKPQPSKSMRTTKFVGRILRISPRISGNFMGKPWRNLWEVKLISADKDEIRDWHPCADGFFQCSPVLSWQLLPQLTTGHQFSPVTMGSSLAPSRCQSRCIQASHFDCASYPSPWAGNEVSYCPEGCHGPHLWGPTRNSMATGIVAWLGSARICYRNAMSRLCSPEWVLNASLNFLMTILG